MDFANLNLSDRVRVVVSEGVPLLDLVSEFNDSGCSDIELVIPEQETRRVKDSFPLNAKLESLVEQDKLEIYQVDVSDQQTIILGETTAYVSVEFEAVNEFVEIHSQEVRSALESQYDAIVEQAETIDLGIVGWENLLTQLESTVDSDTRQEFERLIEAARLENLGALDEYFVAIIAAAQSGALQYDLSKWAETVGLASKATFSRRKSKLEEQGIIQTEKVPTEIGRPKLRLRLSPNIEAVKIQGDNLDYSRNTSAPVSTSSSSKTNEETSQDSLDDTPSPGERKPSSDSPLAKIEAEVREVISEQ